MSRPLRIEFAGALYYLTSRGNGGSPVLGTDAKRGLFLEVLAEVVQAYRWDAHAYCLLDNQYHLLIETPEPNLAKGMRQLNGVFTQRFNQRHNRTGPLFQGRYRAIIVEKKVFSSELARTLALIPVKARLAREAGDWPWSSYLSTAGLAPPPRGLRLDGPLAAFAGPPKAAQQAYVRYVADGLDQPGPWDHLRQQILLGSAPFVREMQQRMAALTDPDVPSPPSRRPDPEALIQITARYPRNEAIGQAYASGQFTLKELGEHFGLHYSRISRILGEWRAAQAKV
jgi:REP element-mobilizing transposase RayT